LVILTVLNDESSTVKLSSMKIAVSTNDGLHVAPDFEGARGFLFFTVALGEITHQEWCPSARPGNLPVEEKVSALSDCSGIIVRNIQSSSSRLLQDHGIPVIRSGGEIITNVIVQYLEREYRSASNTCCCP
jgi:predicted Fe-Mo cluster-binding NifX family protein